MLSISSETGKRGTLLNNSLSNKRVWGDVVSFGLGIRTASDRFFGDPSPLPFNLGNVPYWFRPTMHQQWLSDLLEGCLDREIAGSRCSVEVGLWLKWKTKVLGVKGDFVVNWLSQSWNLIIRTKTFVWHLGGGWIMLKHSVFFSLVMILCDTIVVG